MASLFPMKSLSATISIIYPVFIWIFWWS